jgi:hypothetical protein
MSVMTLLARVSKPQGTIPATANITCQRQGNVLQRMSQGTTTSITNGNIPIHVNNGHLPHQFHGVRAVFAKFILQAARGEGEKEIATCESVRARRIWFNTS